MTAPRLWQLGIDFGTSYTVAAVASDSGVQVLDIESNGQVRMPSAVFATESGDVLVGTAAQHQSVFAPERYEATPKRCMADSELFLGEDFVPVTSLVCAVLRKVYTEASRRQGGTQPSAVRLTHPAEWGKTRLAVLLEAAEKAGLPNVTLVPEPVAAAVWIAGAVTRPGQLIAVYDFGGGTFDAAVLRRTTDGFEVAGPPAGRDPLGGEDIDRRIVEYIGTLVAPTAAQEWAELTNPKEITWRRRANALHMEVQRAKETLSEVTVCQLWLPGLERELQLTRDELERLISDDLDLCTQTLLAALEDAHVRPDQLQGLYLVGGSSRIPAAAEKLWRQLGIRPSVQDSPKSVVALGAARWTTTNGRPQAASPSERTVVTAVDLPRLTLGGTDQQGRVVMPPALHLTLPPSMAQWRGGVTTFQAVDRVSGGPPATIRVRDEPSRGGSVGFLAQQAGKVRAARTPTFVDMGLSPCRMASRDSIQRSFRISPHGVAVPMVERYAVAGDRALVMAFPAAVATVADDLAFPSWPATGLDMTAPAVLPQPAGWVTTEQIRLTGPDGARILHAERAPLPDEPEEAWRWHRLESLLRELPESGSAGRTSGRIMGLPGDIVTVRWRLHAEVMLTKLGTAAAAGQAFVLTLTLPLARQDQFPMFANLVTVAGR